jgi:hypothetical protein
MGLCYKKWNVLYPIPFDDPTQIDSESVCAFASSFILGAKRGVWGNCNFEATITSY